MNDPRVTSVALEVARILLTVAEYPIENEVILSDSILSVKAFNLDGGSGR